MSDPHHLGEPTPPEDGTDIYEVVDDTERPPPPQGTIGEPPEPTTGLFQARYREVTIAAVLFGLIIGVVMNAAITYAGLKIGFTIGGSAIAAVLGFGFLRGILRKGSILETNIAQTVASAVNTSNSGIIFTVPVLFLLGFTLSWKDSSFWLIAGAGVAGAILGCAFIIPLRKQMIDIDRLRFPTGTGVATILKSPGAGPKKAVVLVIGILLSALFYLPSGLPGIQRAAELDSLDSLIDRERITGADAERTRMIARWIEAQEAPQNVVERGELVARYAEARAALSLAREAEEGVAEARAERDRAREALQATPPIELVGDPLARAAYEADAGRREWASLRDRDLGWASHPLPGYQDLNWRLPEHYERGSDRLVENYDHNRDGRPDLVLTDNTIDVGRLLGLPGQYQLIFALAPFALGAGFITGKPGLLVLAGGILAYFILNPVAHAMGWLPGHLRPHQAPDFMFGTVNRPLGIGLLLGGALMGVVAALPAIRAALKSIAGAKRSGASDELGLRVLAAAAAGALLLLFLAADFVGSNPINPACPVTGHEVEPGVDTVEHRGFAIGFADEDARDVWMADWSEAQRDGYLEERNAREGWLSRLGLGHHWRAVAIAVLGGLWMWFAGIIIAQCTGMTDWSPISGLALLTVVLVLLLAGTGAVIGAVLIGAALCVAITLAADMMSDLKTGYLVGAMPRRQQTVELIVVGIGPIICMLTLLLIVQVNLQTTGAPIGPETPTPAPQAQALEAVITGVQGGAMPYILYGVGALLGVLLGFGSFAGLGVLVGLSVYLPFFYIATYGIGCVVNMIVRAIKGRRFVEEWGVPFAAGLIVGEAILALIINIIVLALG